jgi:hypothetical protein
VTLEQIEATLPGGFHDARLRRMEVDYVRRAARIDFVLDAGDPESEDIGDREAWRPAHVVVADLLFLAVEPPGTRHESYSGEARITFSSPASADQQARLPELPAGAFCHALFAANWNAWVFVAGRDARLYWER